MDIEGKIISILTIKNDATEGLSDYQVQILEPINDSVRRVVGEFSVLAQYNPGESIEQEVERIKGILRAA